MHYLKYLTCSLRERLLPGITCFYRVVSSPFNNLKRTFILSMFLPLEALNYGLLGAKCHEELYEEYNFDKPGNILEEVSLLLLIYHRELTNVNYLTNDKVKLIIMRVLEEMISNPTHHLELYSMDDGVKHLIEKAIEGLIKENSKDSLSLARHKEAYIKRTMEVISDFPALTSPVRYSNFVRFSWFLTN